MPNWLSSLFGGDADEPSVSTQPLRSPVDIKLDKIYIKFCYFIGIYANLNMDDWRAPWRAKLDGGFRFVLITLPSMRRHNESDGPVRRMVHPHRNDLPSADELEEFCHSAAFADLIREHVVEWQLEALAWNASCGPNHRYSDEEIACPHVTAHLLDDDNDPPPRCQVLAHRFDPPTPPAPVLAKLEPPPTQPGISNALQPPTPDQGRRR